MAQKIMIVDDEEAFGEIGEMILTRVGFEVFRCRSAAEALAALPKENPDMVLSDVEMPEMDGFDFLRRVRAHPVYKDMPFALMSARRTFPPDRVKGLTLGSDDYIAKPFSGDELVARVRAVLRRAGKAAPPAPAGVETPPPLSSETLNKFLSGEFQPGPLPSAPAAAPAADAPSAPPASPAPAAPAAPASDGAAALARPSVLEELERRVKAEEACAVVLVNLGFFRGFNECLGFEKGDEVLKFTLECLSGAGASIPGGRDAAGPLYADEFLVVTAPHRAVSIAQNALQAFSNGILAYYPDRALTMGFIEAKNRQGRVKAYPFVNLVMAVVSNADRKLTHAGQYIHIGRELLAYAKTLGGSRYVVDRRKDPAPGAAATA